MSAAYYYRQSGRLPLCLVTTGAGSANAITGVLAAYFDSIPLLVISGNEPSRFLAEKQRVRGYQGYESDDFADPIVKDHTRLYATDNVGKMLDEYMSIALAPRQGPVWLDVPKDVQTSDLSV